MNRVLMGVSVFLTLVSVGAFLWLTGILDWRGSDGNIELHLVNICDDKASLRGLANIQLIFDDEKETDLFYSFQPGDKNHMEGCRAIDLTPSPKPAMITAVGGILNAYLALALLKRQTRQDS